MGCFPWEIPSHLKDIIFCDGKNLTVLYCHCITISSRSNQVTVGQCSQMCRLGKCYCSLYTKLETWSNLTNLNSKVCGLYSRTGQLCGDCMKGYGAPIYSYSMVCAKCDENMVLRNSLKYLSAAFLPVTAFYLMCIVLKISISSGLMTSYVLISQVYTIPDVIETVLSPSTHPTLGIKILVSFYSIWNMDIFRAVYSSFCLHPSLNTMHTIAFDYLIALYPLAFIILTYLMVSLCDMVKPKLPRHMFLNVGLKFEFRVSMITAFTTFLVLSYTKILGTSFRLLSPSYVYNIMNGNRSLYLYDEGEIPYFGEEHLPFGILAIVMTATCNVFPVILLVLYPTSCFRTRVNSHTLSAFMDAFQGCYRHHPRDCRYFAAIHFVFRAVIFVLLQLTRNSLFIPMAGLSYLVLTCIVIIVKPYQSSWLNYAEIFLYMVTALNCFSLYFSYYYMRLIKPYLSDSKFILAVPASLMFFISTCYGIVLLLCISMPTQLTKRLFQWCIIKCRAHVPK